MMAAASFMSKFQVSFQQQQRQKQQSRPINDVISYSKMMIDQKPIARGAFGIVHRAYHRDWGCQVAYKKLNLGYITEKNIKALKDEAEIHRHLRHPRIVSMLGVVCEVDNYGLVLEYVHYGSLESFISRLKDITGKEFNVSWRLKTKLARGVCCGMSYLHTLPDPVIHGDLKMQNILIGKDFNAKISDFGLAKWKGCSRSLTYAGTVQGTTSHIPPEKWLNHQLSATVKFDVYSFGILLCEMLTESEAFVESRAIGGLIAELVKTGERPSTEKIPVDVPWLIRSCITSCWNQDPEKRPNFRDLITDLAQFLDGSQEKSDLNHEAMDVLSVYNRGTDSTPQTEHGRKMERACSQLCEAIRRTDQILAHLRTQRAITTIEYDMILSQSTFHAFTICLISVLSLKPVASYQSLLDALKITHQEHLYRLLEDGTDVNIDHREVLIDNYVFLKSSLIISGSQLLEHLRVAGVLDDQEADEIASQRSEHERIERLLKMIMRTSAEQYQLFLQTLINSQQNFIADTLQGKPNPQPIKPLARLNTRRKVRGVTSLNGKLFCICKSSNVIEVFEIKTFLPQSDIKLDQITEKELQASDMAACSMRNCLYIYDKNNDVILCVVDAGRGRVKKWLSVKGCHYVWTLSVTSDARMLISGFEPSRIDIYSPEAALIHSVNLPAEVGYPRHVVESHSHAYFLISRVAGSAGKVFSLKEEFDKCQIVKEWSNSVDGDAGMLIFHLAACDLGLFVTDHGEQRLLLLDHSLEACKKMPGHRELFNSPARICYTEQEGQKLLAVGNDIDGGVDVFSIS